FITDVTPAGLGARVSWAPANASVTIDSYTLKAKPAPGQSVSGACASPPTASASGGDTSARGNGPCAGLAYKVTIKATNARGTSAASALSTPVVPLAASAAGAPMIVHAFSRDGGVALAWAPPADDGGSAIASFQATATQGSTTINTTFAAAATDGTIT